MKFLVMVLTLPLAVNAIADVPRDYEKVAKSLFSSSLSEAGLGFPLEGFSGMLAYSSNTPCVVGDLREEMSKNPESSTKLETPVREFDSKTVKGITGTFTGYVTLSQHVMATHSRLIYLDNPIRNPALSDAQFDRNCRGKRFLAAVNLSKRLGVSISHSLQGTQAEAEQFVSAVENDNTITTVAFLDVPALRARVEEIAERIGPNHSEHFLPAYAAESMPQWDFIGCSDWKSEKCKTSVDKIKVYFGNQFQQHFSEENIKKGKSLVALGAPTPDLDVLDIYQSKNEME